MLFTYKYYAYLFSILSGQNVGPFVLRGDHFYAKNPKTGERFKTLREIREAYGVSEGDESRGIGDYGQRINISIMHCNIALSAGPGTSRSRASSVGFMCQSYSASEQSIFNIVYPTLVFQGMSLIDAKRSAKQVEELFKKTFLVGHENNGGILGISLPKNLADELALHVQMGGKEYDPSVWRLIKDIKAVFKEESLETWKVDALFRTIASQKVGVSTSEIARQIGCSIFFNEEKWADLEKLLESYFSSRSSKDSSISNLLGNIQTAMLQNLSKDEICNLTNEIALYINPEIQPTIFGTFRHPLNPEQEASFDKELKALVDSHVAINNSK